MHILYTTGMPLHATMYPYNPLASVHAPYLLPHTPLPPLPIPGNPPPLTSLKKDIAWILEYLTCTNRMYVIDEDHLEPLFIFVDACTLGAGALCQAEAYHTQFPLSIQERHHPICNIEVLSVVVAIRWWTMELEGSRLTLNNDNAMEEVTFQVRKG